MLKLTFYGVYSETAHVLTRSAVYKYFIVRWWRHNFSSGCYKLCFIHWKLVAVSNVLKDVGRVSDIVCFTVTGFNYWMTVGLLVHLGYQTQHMHNYSVLHNKPNDFQKNAFNVMHFPFDGSMFLPATCSFFLVHLSNFAQMSFPISDRYKSW